MKQKQKIDAIHLCGLFIEEQSTEQSQQLMITATHEQGVVRCVQVCWTGLNKRLAARRNRH